MKKGKMLVAAMILVLVVPAISFADSDRVVWDSYFQPGNLALSVGVGFGYWEAFSIAVYPGAELILTGVKIADVVPLQFGVAAKGMVNTYTVGYSGIILGGGAFGTVHLSFKGLDLPFTYLDRLDIYLGLGLVINYNTEGWDYLGYTTPILLGFASYSGFNYFINDKLAVYVEGNYWTRSGGATVGILLRL